MKTKDNRMYRVVYNDCHGGFDLSEKGMAEYNHRTSQLTYPDGITRDDPVLLHMVDTMDPAVINSEYSRLKIKEFPIIFREFLEWREYDGLESVRVDYHKYIVHTVKSILDADVSAEEKIGRISQLYADCTFYTFGH
jgi:hypothetical protein